MLVSSKDGTDLEAAQVAFPDGQDGEADVFVLLERKDEMEMLIQDIVNNIDFLLSKQLFAFLGAESGLQAYVDHVIRAQALIRAYIRRKSVLKVCSSMQPRCVVLLCADICHRSCVTSMTRSRGYCSTCFPGRKGCPCWPSRRGQKRQGKCRVYDGESCGWRSTRTPMPCRSCASLPSSGSKPARRTKIG